LPHAIFDAECYFRRNSADRRRDRGYGHSGKIGEGTAAGENENRPLFVRGGEPVKADLASL
jgi:hypothetical protein